MTVTTLPASARAVSPIPGHVCEAASASPASPSSEVFWLDEAWSNQSTDSLRQRAADLVGRYVRAPSRQLAEQVGACIASLAWHPDVCRDPRCHCAYRGLVRHWFWLAGHGGHQPS